LSKNQVNISSVRVGDVFAMGVSDNPQELASNASAISYLRMGEITRKTPTDIVVDFGYPTADIRVVSVQNTR
jgi:hypothetical protein